MRSLRSCLVAASFLTLLSSGPVRAEGAKPAAEPAAAAAPQAAPAVAPGNTAPTDAPADPAAMTTTAAPVNPDSTPAGIRLRQLEQRVQALKEQTWRVKARVNMLKEAVLGGGIGARATLVHENKMGGSFRLIKVVYALDGQQIFTRSDDSGALHDLKKLDVLSGPIAPGNHTLSVLLVYRGHGYGVFNYLKGYKFTVRSSHTFTAAEGRATAITVVGYERGGATTPLEKRPAIDFRVNVAADGGAAPKAK